jgi:hypothetical protein
MARYTWMKSFLWWCCWIAKPDSPEADLIDKTIASYEDDLLYYTEAKDAGMIKVISLVVKSLIYYKQNKGLDTSDIIKG